MVKVKKEDFIKKYNVVNFSWNKWTSKAIKIGTQSHWSHTGIIVGNTGDVVQILEASPKGNKIEEYPIEWMRKAYEDKVIEIIDFGINPKIDDLYWNEWISHNKIYGFESILALILYKLGFKTNINIVGTVICSELVSKLLYILSNKTILLGYNPKQIDEKYKSEYNVEFWRVEPKHISLSKYGERLRLEE